MIRDRFGALQNNASNPRLCSLNENSEPIKAKFQFNFKEQMHYDKINVLPVPESVGLKATSTKK